MKKPNRISHGNNFQISFHLKSHNAVYSSRRGVKWQQYFLNIHHHSFQICLIFGSDECHVDFYVSSKFHVFWKTTPDCSKDFDKNEKITLHRFFFSPIGESFDFSQRFAGIHRLKKNIFHPIKAIKPLKLFTPMPLIHKRK